jgi:FkbM family methyltransferase
MESKNPEITLLEIIKHIIQEHPAIEKNVDKIIKDQYKKNDEFEKNIKKWFEVKGDETLRLDYPLDSESIVFDLGGYEGDFAYEINRKYDSYVFLFEPSKQFFENCVRRFENNKKIKCFNIGFSDKDGEFYLGNDGNASSMFRNFDSKSEQIIIKDITRSFCDFAVNKIDLMKINIEGPEFLILEKLIQTTLISKIKYIQVQFHEFYPDSWKLRDNIRLSLSLTHSEMWNYPFVWESWKINV